MLVPTAIGIIEMFRQFKILDKKNAEMDERFYKNVRKLKDKYYK